MIKSPVAKAWRGGGKSNNSLQYFLLIFTMNKMPTASPKSFVYPEVEKSPADDYVPFCPHGHWRGRLDRKLLRRDGNLFLYFTDLDTGRRWRLSAWARTQYRPTKGELNLRTDVAEGDVLQLVSIRAHNGSPYLIEATKIEKV